jgi:hypothetical protein
MRRVDDVTMIADPVGQCAQTTVAEDTVQFVAAVTDQRVVHLVRGNKARKIFDPENRRLAVDRRCYPCDISKFYD